MTALAHLKGRLEHRLVTHLLDVARRAEGFARRIRPGDDRFAALAFWAGLFHDLGKYRTEFQEYLRGERGKGVDTQHAVFGAALAWEVLAKAIGVVINGHHSGLHDFDQCKKRVLSGELQP